jgi:hypothetical protein
MENFPEQLREHSSSPEFRPHVCRRHCAVPVVLEEGRSPSGSAAQHSDYAAACNGYEKSLAAIDELAAGKA